MTKISLFIFSILFYAVGNSQSFKCSKIVVDKTTKLPLEDVFIFNETDNSTTNQEGTFVFVSSKTEINFNLLGYNPVVTTFEETEKKDTIFMTPKAFILQEVVVSNSESFIKKALSATGNYIPNYASTFFLRNVLKKENDIIVLQDIQAKRGKRVVSSKVINEIELLNMRKTSQFEKHSAGFRFFNFDQFLTPPFPTYKDWNFTEVEYSDPDYRKFLFESKVLNSYKQHPKGYLIINKTDYGVVEIFMSWFDDPAVGPYKKAGFSGAQYRSTKEERLFRYAKNSVQNKYYLYSAKSVSQVEVLGDKRNEKTFYFDFTMDYFITNSISFEKVTPNFDADKDIFKAKYPYSVDFWNSQSQLPLTNELKVFLKQVSENKDKKKEFDIIGNF